MPIHLADGRDVSPTPGAAFVELESEFDVTLLGGLVLPESMKRKKTMVGRIVASNVTGKDAAHLGTDSLDGRRVVVDWKYVTLIDGKIHHVPLLVERKREDGQSFKPKRYDTPIQAILGEDVEVSAVQDEAPRCRHCGPAKSSNSPRSMLLVAGRGGINYCPRCKKTAAGDIYADYDGSEVT